jgi:hypothetical protein
MLALTTMDMGIRLTVCQGIVLRHANSAQASHGLHVERGVLADTVCFCLCIRRSALAGARELDERSADVFASWWNLAVGDALVVGQGRCRYQADGGQQCEEGGKGTHIVQQKKVIEVST